jgi:hypothetical protein
MSSVQLLKGDTRIKSGYDGNGIIIGTFGRIAALST